MNNQVTRTYIAVEVEQNIQQQQLIVNQKKKKTHLTSDDPSFKVENFEKNPFQTTLRAFNSHLTPFH